MRNGPVKRLDRHEELHQKVKGLFSAFTLFTLYAFFAAEVDQREMPSNFFVRDMVDLFLLWTVDYPDTREIHATYGVPPVVFNRVIRLFSQRVPLYFFFLRFPVQIYHLESIIHRCQPIESNLFYSLRGGNAFVRPPRGIEEYRPDSSISHLPVW